MRFEYSPGVCCMLWHALTGPLSCSLFVPRRCTDSALIPSTRHMPQQTAEGSEMYAVAHASQLLNTCGCRKTQSLCMPRPTAPSVLE